MSTKETPVEIRIAPRPRRRLEHMVFRCAAATLLTWLFAAYFLLPLLWRRYELRHPALDGSSWITRTGNDIPGDPLNIALVGNEEEIVTAMLAAKWFPADAITLRSSLRIAAGTLLRRSYRTAPVSNLFVWSRKQDLAFEQPAGKDPRRRHHVRFWRAEEVDEDGRELWVGAATFDTSAGLSHTTGQITHHIDADVDAERDKLLADLDESGAVAQVYWIEGFHERLRGRNGGGDPYYTDGRLPVAVLAEGK